MSKAMYFAAALALAPLPVLAQQGQPGGGAQSFSTRGEHGGEAYGGEGAFEEEGSRFTRGDLLDRLAHSDLRDRIASGIEHVEEACGPDIERYCGEISPGEDRIAACMHAYSDQLSRRCRFTLSRISRNIRQTVQTIADECWNGIQQQCGSAGNIGECVVQKSASLSPSCQTVVQAIHEVGQKLAQLKNVHVYSSDGVDLGPVVEVKRTPDGRLQSVQIQVGRFLGIGDKIVSIEGDQLQQLQDRVRLRLNADQVRNMPEARQAQQ